MPKVEQGSLLLETTLAFQNPMEFYEHVILLLKKCNECIIVTNPSIAVARYDDLDVEVAIGVGSIICSKCSKSLNIKYKRLAKISSSAWIEGKNVRANSSCSLYVMGELFHYNNLIRSLESMVPIVNFNFKKLDIIEESLPEPGLLITTHLPRLFKIEENNVCGSFSSANPLHPAGFLGKPLSRYNTCIARYALIGHPRYAKLAYDILFLGNKPIIQEYRGYRRLIIYNYDPISINNDYLKLAFLLGVLYTCG